MKKSSKYGLQQDRREEMGQTWYLKKGQEQCQSTNSRSCKETQTHTERTNHRHIVARSTSPKNKDKGKLLNVQRKGQESSSVPTYTEGTGDRGQGTGGGQNFIPSENVPNKRTTGHDGTRLESQQLPRQVDLHKTSLVYTSSSRTHQAYITLL